MYLCPCPVALFAREYASLEHSIMRADAAMNGPELDRLMRSRAKLIDQSSYFTPLSEEGRAFHKLIAAELLEFIGDKPARAKDARKASEAVARMTSTVCGVSVAA